MLAVLITIATQISASPQEGIAECLRASAQGDVMAVQKLLGSYGTQLANMATANGKSPLMVASLYGHEAVVQALLQAGANCRYVRASDGVTALYAAAQAGHTAIVQVLLTAGADPDSWGPQQTPALVKSADCGHVQVVDLLLTAGANPDAVDRNGLTALMAAAQKGSVALAKRLLDARADMNIKCYVAGHSALMYAIQYEQDAVASLLIERGAEIESVSHNGCTPLLGAAEYGCEHILCQLLLVGAEVAVTVNGINAVYLAAQRNYTHAIELLAAAGADIDGSAMLITPLGVSVRNAYFRTTRSLLKLGAHPDVIDADRKSLLDYLLVHKSETGETITGHDQEAKKQQLQQQCVKLAKMLFQRGFSRYTQKQLHELGIMQGQVHGSIDRLRRAFAGYCAAQVAHDRHYAQFPGDLERLIGSFIGGSIAQKAAC